MHGHSRRHPLAKRLMVIPLTLEKTEQVSSFPRVKTQTVRFPLSYRRRKEVSFHCWPNGRQELSWPRKYIDIVRQTRDADFVQRGGGTAVVSGVLAPPPAATRLWHSPTATRGMRGDTEKGAEKLWRPYFAPPTLPPPPHPPRLAAAVEAVQTSPTPSALSPLCAHVRAAARS